MDEVRSESRENRKVNTVSERAFEENIGAGEKTARRGGEARSRVYHPLVELTRVRLREFIREREAVFWVFVFPVLLAFALGIAFRNTAPEKIRIAVLDDGRGAIAGNSSGAGSEIVQSLKRTSDIEPMLLSETEAVNALRSGRVALVVRPVAPESESGASRDFDYRYDPTRPESRTARLAVDDALQRARGRADVARARDEMVTEPGARYIDFLIPGLIGLNLMGSGMWGLGFAIVVARGRKLLKRFAATPMRRSHYLISFMLSRLVFLVLEVVAVLVFGWLVFGVAVRGSVFSVGVIALLGGFTFSGLGLLVASRPTTIEGVSGLMNFVMLPMWLLSGTFFSSARFPEILQPFVKALPLTAVNDSLRAVINDGASLASNWPALLVLLTWCVVSFVVALRIFRWQ